MVSVVAPDRTFGLTVDRLDAPRTMAWSGGLPLALHRGVRTSTLTPLDGRRTDFGAAHPFGPTAAAAWPT